MLILQSCSFFQGGYTALHKAAGNGHLDVLELLINEGCDIDTQDDMVRLEYSICKGCYNNLNCNKFAKIVGKFYVVINIKLLKKLLQL